MQDFLFQVSVLFDSPDLVEEVLNKEWTVLFFRLQVWPVYNVMEENADFENKFICFGQFIKSHRFLVIFQVLEHRSYMMIGMVISPILTVILNDDIPPFSAHQMVLLFWTANQFVESFDHPQPDSLVLGKLFDCQTIFSQNMSTDLSWGNLIFNWFQGSQVMNWSQQWASLNNQRREVKLLSFLVDRISNSQRLRCNGNSIDILFSYCWSIWIMEFNKFDFNVVIAFFYELAHFIDSHQVRLNDLLVCFFLEHCLRSNSNDKFFLGG